MSEPGDKNPVLIESDHSGPFERDGHCVNVFIYKLEDRFGWTLEAVDHEGNSTVWNDEFDSDDAAWSAFLRMIEEEGIEPLVGPTDRHTHH